MNGIDFYESLRRNIEPNAQLGNYTFKGWLTNGNLQFEINPNQKKSIPPELLIMAYHIKKRNNKVKQELTIDYRWLVNNGHTDWCFIEVINHLVDFY